ncbi:MAG: ATPase [Alphaproteobacteria bacterium]|nr:ATPase [Alphaproteobacteria bacterium]
MRVGDILVAKGLITQDDVAAALEHQKAMGGRLGDILVASGKLTSADLEAIMQEAPSPPATIEDTGLPVMDLLNLTMKAMYAAGAETASAVAEITKLPNRVVQLLLEQAKERKLLEVLGAAGLRVTSELRFAVTEKGKHWAVDALNQNQYVGPAPVPLPEYCERIERQRITNERVDRESIAAAFADMIVPDAFIRQVGPAINSGRSMLLYGPPGNGKTSFAERIGRVFRNVVYVPYCFEVEGQIIKVFDPGVHEPIAQNGAESTGARLAGLRRDDFDRRWVACKRPFIVAGGELTLEMLDLSFNTLAKFYEAPLHVKALNGIFMIDDFGRQIVSPEALLNRWIVPLERRVDYLKLHTGKSFCLPFDELVIFSTNLTPKDLMDPAFLRRIPYKLEVGAPSREDFRQIFQAISALRGLQAEEQVTNSVIAALQELGGVPLASYQPRFIVDQVLSACKFENIPPRFRPDLIAMAIGNLTVEKESASANSTRPVSN